MISRLLVLLSLALSLTMNVRAEGAPEDPAAWLKKTIGPCFTQNESASLKAREKVERTGVTPTLKALLARDAAESAKTHEVARLDFDWILNAQDIPLNWKMGTAKVEGKYTAVPVTTVWSDTNSTYTFLLVPNGKSWLIADVRYPKNYSLLKILQ